MSIGDGWKSYRAVIVPPYAGEIQVSECQRAFYGGAAHLYGLLMRNTEKSEADAMADLSRIRDELDAFARDELLAKGKL